MKKFLHFAISHFTKPLTQLPALPPKNYKESNNLLLSSSPPFPTPSHTFLILQFTLPFLRPPQIIYFPIACAPFPHLLTIDSPLPTPRIPAALNFVFAVEIRACYVETVDMAGENAGDEEKGVDEAIHPRPCNEHY